MSGRRSPDYLQNLVRELCALPTETGWVEFKSNKVESMEIGEYISALANSATLEEKDSAYLLWGVEDQTHDLIGTSFQPATHKVGNEELENWLLHSLTPRVGLRFHEVQLDGQKVVLLEIDKATHRPVQFRGVEFVRVGSYKKKLKDCPEKAAALWRAFDRVSFEVGVALERLTEDRVLRLLDHPAYFELLSLPLPDGRQRILLALEADRLIKRCDAGGWSITNLGAVLFAKDLTDFPTLGRKTARVIVYGGPSRTDPAKEWLCKKGYAAGFEALIAYINGVLPSNEVIESALRKSVAMYPEIAVRELVANALIHQDFFITGAGPMVEIFENRAEITNPGKPLVATDRFLDTPPQSRNEALASLMRRMGICEERGSGVDKVVFEAEFYQLPPPLFELVMESTRAVLFAPMPLTKMEKGERVRACYLHACLKHVNREYLTNATVRRRFGIEEKNSAKASRIIKEAVDDGAIMADDENAGRKYMKYLPWWARDSAKD